MLFEALLKNLRRLSLGPEKVELFGELISLLFEFITRSGCGVMQDFRFGDFSAEVVKDDFVLHEMECF